MSRNMGILGHLAAAGKDVPVKHREVNIKKLNPGDIVVGLNGQVTPGRRDEVHFAAWSRDQVVYHVVMKNTVTGVKQLYRLPGLVSFTVEEPDAT